MQMKSSVRTPRGGMQSHSVIPSGLPKHGKPQKNGKPNNHQTSKPNPVHESSDVAVKAFSAFQNVESSSEIPKEVLNTMLHENTAGNISNNMTEGHVTGVHDLNLGSTHNIGTVDISMEKISPQIKSSISTMDIGTSSTDEKRNRSDSSSTHDVEYSSSEIVEEASTYGDYNLPKAEDPLHVSHDIGMHFPHLCYTENKEVLDISMDQKSPEGKNAVHSENSIDILTVDDHNSSVSSATVIDGLSNQLGVMDIKSETQKKFNGHSLSLSDSGVSYQENVHGVELSSRKELPDFPRKEESLNGPNTPSLYIPAHTRTPFTVKDSFCNMDGLFSVSTESTVAAVKSTILPSPDSTMTENN